MTLTLDIPSEVESILAEAARRQGKTPEQLAAETLRVNFAPPETDLALPPEQRELTAITAIEEGIYEYQEETHG